MFSKKVEIDNYREFLKDSVRKKIDFRYTDQNSGIEAPPFEVEVKENASIIYFPDISDFEINVGLRKLIESRSSVRVYSKESLSLAEFGFLLWATQGVREIVSDHNALRTVPSAGCRHSFETYIAVMRVEGLKEGLYRYIPSKHAVEFLKSIRDIEMKITKAGFGQRFIADAAAVFFWTTIPYRMEWRYDLAAHRAILIDAGHVCQNLYLAAEAIGGGTCAVAAFDQTMTDSFLGVDGEEEFCIYLAPVGKKP